MFEDNNAIIMDAKWKVLNTSDEKLEVAQSDLYQLLTYSEIIKNKMAIENVSLALLYPKTDKFNKTRIWTYFNGTQISIVPIDVLNFDNNSQLISALHIKSIYNQRPIQRQKAQCLLNNIYKYIKNFFI